MIQMEIKQIGFIKLHSQPECVMIVHPTIPAPVRALSCSFQQIDVRNIDIAATMLFSAPPFPNDMHAGPVMCSIR